jgi:hypothetical protein
MSIPMSPSPFFNEAIIHSADESSIGIAANAHHSNITVSGQLGTGIRFTKLDGATPAVFSPAVVVVLNTPSMWERYPRLQKMLRAIVETHAKSITGIDFGYRLNADEAMPVGHDGQQLKVPTRTERTAVDPVITVQEYPGMPVYNLFKTWMFDINHPDTNMSVLPAQMYDGKDANYDNIPGWFVSAYSMSIAVIQYDPSGIPDRIYDAAIITNMFPTEIGNIGFERTINTTKPLERQITFTGLVQHNENTRALGVNIAKALGQHRVNYDFALPGLAGTANVSEEDIKKGNNAYKGSFASSGNESGLYFETLGANGSIGAFGTVSDHSYNDRIPNNNKEASTGTANEVPGTTSA